MRCPINEWLRAAKWKVNILFICHTCASAHSITWRVSRETIFLFFFVLLVFSMLSVVVMSRGLSSVIWNTQNTHHCWYSCQFHDSRKQSTNGRWTYQFLRRGIRNALCSPYTMGSLSTWNDVVINWSQHVLRKILIFCSFGASECAADIIRCTTTINYLSIVCVFLFSSHFPF